MKTSLITPQGEMKIQPLDGGGYRVTGHAIPTTTLTGEEEIVAKFTNPDGYVELRAKDGAIINLSPDTRHGQAGFRGTRYEQIGNKTHWDECYMFFPTLGEAIELFGKPTNQTETGIQEARRRF